MIQDFHTYLFFCRVQERQREQEQRYLRAELRKVHRASVWQHILGRLSACFMTPAASEQQRNMSIPLEVFVSEEEKLTQDGFTAEEIVALYRLRQWYQRWGSEHLVMMRHWEFLKLLVKDGKLEA